jgi:hypothetical protein
MAAGADTVVDTDLAVADTVAAATVAPIVAVPTGVEALEPITVAERHSAAEPVIAAEPTAEERIGAAQFGAAERFAVAVDSVAVAPSAAAAVVADSTAAAAVTAVVDTGKQNAKKAHSQEWAFLFCARFPLLHHCFDH